jgi:hypothetical protein
MTTNPHSMLKTPSRILLAISCLGFISCSTGIDMPKGSSKGYTSARLVNRNPNQPAITNSTELKVHRMIQKSLDSRFTANGLAYGGGNADLTVAYLVIYQEPGMTALYDDYFGYGRDAGEISDIAHTRGALDSGRPDYFHQAGILIDVIDSDTNKLVYRNHVKGDVVRSASDATRASRIDAAVGQALEPFFSKN